MILDDLVLNIASVNGSGTQSSNNIIVRTLFRMGYPVAGKNLFPSNIAGLPTWFNIRVNTAGWVSRKYPHDVVIALNPDTITQDIKSVREGGVFIFNSDIKFDAILLRKDVQNISVPFREIVKDLADSIKIKKLLGNMVYVGLLAECFKFDFNILKSVVADQFQDKESVVKANLLAINAGMEFAKKELAQFPFTLSPSKTSNTDKILIDGNSAAAMGLVMGGCQFVSWYPITPSTSVVENFQRWAEKHCKDVDGKNDFSVVQAEDELSAISMVLGASWAGARAMTATSGPGLSLMSEAAGLSYFAEVPAVIWDVQRVGPSTGLPTRTMQGDLISAYYLSHGDTRHVVLLPGSPQECYSFAQLALDLAEQLQTMIIVLSDLDLGMNFSMSPKFTAGSLPLKRGKVLDAEALKKLSTPFARYRDVDGDGVCHRTLPGTHHPDAAFFTRGTGHDEMARYTEDNENFKRLLDRLAKKWETAKTLVPEPIIEIKKDARTALLAYGSSDSAVQETRAQLLNKNVLTSYCRLRALPLTQSTIDFISAHDTVYVVEQNRDAQLMTILRSEHPELAGRLKSIRQYDGLPLAAQYVYQQVKS